MSDDFPTIPQSPDTLSPEQEDDEQLDRRKLVGWMLLLLLLLLIPAVLCGPRLLQNLRRDVVVDLTEEPLATEEATVEAMSNPETEEPGADTSTEEPTQPECGDQVCDTGEVCPADCGEEETETPPDETQEPLPPSSCTVNCGPPSGGCGDGICAADESTATCPADCPPDDPAAAGGCGAVCTSSDDCNGLSCVFGFCWDTEVCLGLPPGDQPPSDDLCGENGGIQWQGEVCVCAGVVDVVTICADGAKTDTLTDIACTPDPAACPIETEEPPYCGNGIIDPGEECDGDAAICGGGNWWCDVNCTCQD